MVSPTTDEIRESLPSILTYKSKRMLHGIEAKRRGIPVEETEHQIYLVDHADRIVTAFGLHDRVYRKLVALGYPVMYKDQAPHPRPEVFEPLWHRLYEPSRNIELREGQPEFLIKMMSHPCGRFDCPPGFGKSFMIGCIATLLPKARIDVVTKSLAVLYDRLYPEMCMTVPNVGIICSKKKVRDRRVMLLSAGSVHHADGKADIVIADECHELAADSYAEKLAVYDNARMYGLSATQDMRLDNKDMRVEAMFGPVLYRMPYEQAKNSGLVVPIEVLWTDVIMNFNPAGEYEDSVERKRWGIWRNDYRNELIAADANQYGDDTQVLITCETIGHMVQLKKLLPDYEIVYSENGMSALDRRKYIRQGLLPKDYEPMSRSKRDRLTRDFESGKLKKAICNKVWNVGVSFNSLAVLIRADAGGSPTNDIQIPGRASRIAEGKDSAIIHDYRDQFDTGFRNKATRRGRTYGKQGWTQVLPKKKSTGRPQDQLSTHDFGARS